MKLNKGFSLIELMTVVLIVAVLAMLAFSGYSKQVQKTRRAEAKQILGDYALRQERLRSNAANYTNSLTTLLNVGTAPTTWGSGYYTVALSFPASGTCASGVNKGSANSFIITATAIADQANDTACTPLVYTNDCGTAIKTPTTCW